LSKDVQLKLPEIVAKQGEEYLLNIYVVTKREMPLIPVGHTIAYEQFGFATNDYFSQVSSNSLSVKPKLSQKTTK